MIIDISKWQGKIDWNLVKIKNPDISGVYIKASEGIGYVDPNFKYNAIEANKVGFKVGYYHFASLNDHNEIADATNEANYFLETIKDYNHTFPLVLDIEKNSSNLTKEEVLLWINTFFTILRNKGEDYLLYSYGSFLNGNLPGNHSLGNIKLWIAAYTSKLILPTGWDTYYLWQYTQEGYIAGINGHVDLNRQPSI